MRDDGDDLLCTMMHDGIGGFDERAARVGHVIDENGNLTVDVTDEDHPRDFVRASSLLVDQGEAKIETVCDGRRSVLLPPRSISFPEQGGLRGLRMVRASSHLRHRD